MFNIAIEMKNKLCFLTVAIAVCFSISTRGQDLSINMGTDFPYQFYAGVTYETDMAAISARSGLLVEPYSSIVIDVVEMLGVREVYIALLDQTYDSGWMNSIGGYYKFGDENQWYLGLEIRVDHLKASKVQESLLFDIIGLNLDLGNFFTRQYELGLTLYGIGLRGGRKFYLDENKKHSLRPEISMYKYVRSHSVLSRNGIKPAELNSILNNLLWEDVFKNYGYVGGIGILYAYRF